MSFSSHSGLYRSAYSISHDYMEVICTVDMAVGTIYIDTTLHPVYILYAWQRVTIYMYSAISNTRGHA